MKSLVRVIDSTSEAVGRAAALLVIPLTLATCWEVFARYVLGAPTIWAFELGYMLMGVHFLMGGAMTLKRQGHVRIDLIYARLSEKGRARIDLICFLLLVLPALALICQRFWEYTAAAYASGEQSGQSAWNPPIWPFRLLIVASFVLLTLQVAAECLRSLRVLLGRAPGAAAPSSEV